MGLWPTKADEDAQHRPSIISLCRRCGARFSVQRRTSVRRLRGLKARAGTLNTVLKNYLDRSLTRAARKRGSVFAAPYRAATVRERCRFLLLQQHVKRAPRRTHQRLSGGASSAERPARRLVLTFCLICVFAAAANAAEPVDWIWSARYVLTMDPERRVIENGAVAIRGADIVAVAARADIDRRYRAKQRLDRPAALIAPGLISTHTHAPMSLLRGIADDLNLQDWLEKYIFPAEAKNVSPAFVRAGTRLAALEMLLSGATTYADMYYFEDIIAAATKEIGLRGVLGETIIGFPSPDARTPAAALAFTEKYIQRFRNDPLIVPAVAPHALYTNSEETLRASRALADRYGVPLLIHLAETRRERDDALAKYGKTPTAVLDGWGVLTGPTLAAHCVWVDDADLRILQARGAGIAHCPSSNMKLASGVAPVTKMLALGLAVGLGPDGPAGSNNDFDLMEEMDLAAKLQKVTTGDPRALPAGQAIEMATIGGARALRMDKQIGSLEPGKRADLITLRLNVPNAVPLYNVCSQFVYALKGADVNDSMVNGRLLLRDRRPLTLDPAAVMKTAAEIAAAVKLSLR